MENKSDDISFFFSPESIAIIGASPAGGKVSNSVMENLRLTGYEGRVSLVNPKYDSINEVKCLDSVTDISEDVDLAIVCVPASAAATVMEEIASKKVKGAILVTAGFKEIGEQGAEIEERISQIARQSGVRLMGPNCLGIFDNISKLDTFFIVRDRIKRPPIGGLSILSQSGSFAGTIMDSLADMGEGVARIVNYGNRADVGETECLEFLAEDPATTAVGIYIESVDDGQKFIRAAQKCVQKKPVFAIKIGRHEAGISATRSHTGAIAGRYEIYRAAFRKAGIIEVTGYGEFLDACRLLTRLKKSGGKRVLILTDGGGMGASVADACADHGLDVTPLPDEVKEKLSSQLPAFCAISNPMDITGSATDQDFITVLDAAMAHYDMVIVMALWGPPLLTDALIGMIKDASVRIAKPFIMCNPGGAYTKKRNKMFEKAGLPVLTTPESAARAAKILSKIK